MDKTQIDSFITAMIPVMLQAGEYAVKNQETISTSERNINFVKATTTERIQKREKAKTEVDVQVQERLLLAVKGLLGNDISVDAEEDTPTKKLFSNRNTSLAVVIDPVDGTLEYITGSKRYSINIGLIEDE